ncbi:MAG: hypothetical protein WC878_06530 [Candidatus Paceibacterota bacterium]|jgi:hypothetical protein
MLNSIRYYWAAFTDSEIFSWIVIILAIAVYCNLGWALGYIWYHPDSFPYWLAFLANPFHLAVGVEAYGIGSQAILAFTGVILWLIEWFCYLVYLIVFGGIAKLLLLP